MKRLFIPILLATVMVFIPGSRAQSQPALLGPPPPGPGDVPPPASSPRATPAGFPTMITNTAPRPASTYRGGTNASPMFQSPARSRTNQPMIGPKPATTTDRPPVATPSAVDKTPTPPANVTFSTASPAPTPTLPVPGPAAGTLGAPGATNTAITPAAQPARPAFPAFPAFPPPEDDTTPVPPGPASPIAPRNIVTGQPPAAASPTNAVPPQKEKVDIQFNNMPFDQVLEYYSEMVGKTVLRHPQFPAQFTITIKLNKSKTYDAVEAKQALDTVLAMNQVTMVAMGDNFILAVPTATAQQEGLAFNTMGLNQLPEAAQYITEMVRLTNALPSEIIPSLTPFARMQNGLTAIDNSGILIIRDYAVNVKRMLEIIKRIDVSVEPDYKLEVIPIKFGKVEDIYNVMSGLIGGGGAGGAGGTAARSTARTGGRRTGVNARGGSNRQNQLGQPGQPNQPQAPQANPNAFQQRLQAIVNRAATGDSQILGDAKIIPDDRSNSLVVYADKRDMSTITNIVAKLDVMLAQVLIEAAIVDVLIGDSMSLGVSAMQSPKTKGNWTGAGGFNNGQSFLSGVTNLATGMPSGFNYYAKYMGDLDVAVSAMASDNSASVLQRPRIQTTHAMPASFFSGSTVPYITSSYYGGGGYGGYGPSSSYQQLRVGIGLDVTPFITPDGLVVMEISQSIEELAGKTKIGQDEVPNTTTREANSMVSVHDGETIILGGFIRDSKSRAKSGVPLLKDIPLLGYLFRSSTRENQRSELIVLLKPTVLKNPEDASRAAKNEMDRLPGAKQAEKEFQDQEQKNLEKANKALKSTKSSSRRSK